MLEQLSISNFILVEQCQMDFSSGLCVLTGETGAGKSILLGALGLLLGERAAGQPLFDDARPAVLTASFHLSDALRDFLQAQAIEFQDDELWIKRQLMPDGKSRAFINDQPVSVGLLKALGGMLMEIHGQQGQRALSDKSLQRAMLDRYGKHGALLAKVTTAYDAWQSMVKKRAEREEAIANAAAQEDYLRHIHAELSALSPQPGEEEELAVKRRQLMQAEQLGGLLRDAQQELEGANPVEAALARVVRLLARPSSAEDAPNSALDALMEALNTAQDQVALAVQQLDSMLLDSGYDPKELDAVESRLFELRGAARKHKRPVEALAEYLQEISETLNALDADESALHALLAEEKQACDVYKKVAQELTQARQQTAEGLAQKVMAELAPLKMEATRFRICLDTLPPDGWSRYGMDQVEFEASTNPGSPFGSLAKIASGGELSRFMLALKVALAEEKADQTLIFDEIDTGTSGAVAEAIGERLAQLGEASQVLVITHLPQVASKGERHFKVAKHTQQEKTRTQVVQLDTSQRREELAAMLSGKEVTSQALEMADSLLKAG